VEEGIVPGGGVSLLKASEKLNGLIDEQESDIRTGILIVKKALVDPMRLIAENAGYDGGVIVEEVRRRNKDNEDPIGFDVMSEDFVNMLEAGIIDPAKVTRSAVENAASIAAMILTTEALITDIPEKEPAMPAGGGGGMDMGGF